MIIKCPECGHQVSDKAPVCPNCGVEIAGNIIKCSNCGEIYLKEEGSCPNCHNIEESTSDSHKSDIQPDTNVYVRPTSTVYEEPVMATPLDSTDSIPSVSPLKQSEKQNPKKKTSNGNAMMISFIIAAILCALLLYFYKDATDSKEAEEYATAMASSDPLVLQGYLDTYRDAPQEHRDSIMSHINRIKDNTTIQNNMDDAEYIKAIETGTRESLMNYLNGHHDTPHRAEIEQRIEKIDWDVAQKSNTEDAYLAFMQQHQDGLYYEAAADKVKGLNATQPVDEAQQQKAITTMRKFFRAINTRSTSTLGNMIADDFAFRGKANATKTDVAEYVNSLYQADVTNLNWHLGELKHIGQTTGGNITVTIPAKMVTERGKIVSTRHYSINAILHENGQISSMNITQVAASENI